jgi:RNase P subunit RPR2
MADKLTKMYCAECGHLTGHSLMARHHDGKLRITTVCAQCGVAGRGKLVHSAKG